MNDMARFEFGQEASQALTESLELLTHLETLAKHLRKDIESNTAARADGSRYLTVSSKPVDSKVAEDLATLAGKVEGQVKKGAALASLARP